MDVAGTIFLTALFVVALVRVPRRVAPSHYFELSELIHGMNNAVTWQAIFLRFSTPFVGCLAGALVLRHSQAVVGLASGFLAALLLIWPTLLDRRLLPWPASQRQNQLYLVYAMFVASFSMLGLAGGYLASYLEQPIAELLTGTDAHKFAEATSSRIDDVVVGIVVVVIGGVFAWIWRRLEKWIQRYPDHDV